jgi:hypothetical protein
MIVSGIFFLEKCSLPFLTDRNEIAQLAEGLPGCLFNELLTDGGSPEIWQALLREFKNEPDRPARRNQNIEKTDLASPESQGRLQKVAQGPWRSLGGYFDYTDWQDRERFMELDMAIARSQHSSEADDELEDFLRSAA